MDRARWRLATRAATSASLPGRMLIPAFSYASATNFWKSCGSMVSGPRRRRDHRLRARERLLAEDLADVEEEDDVVLRLADAQHELRLSGGLGQGRRRLDLRTVDRKHL